jgi:putative phosphoribosyl transferase
MTRDTNTRLIMFQNRQEAGRRLAQLVAVEPDEDAVVVGLARGGVVLAAEVARALGRPLDALAVRKVGHPWQPQYAIGAVTPGGGVFTRARDGLSDEQLEAAVAAAQRHAEALDARLHRRRAPIEVAGRTCVLVDDGLATGATMIAAVRWARRQGAHRIVVAVPVAAAETVARLESMADEVVAIEVSDAFTVVGLWYADFRLVEDREVLALLDRAQPASAAAAEL